jgi:hypothetical protein
MREGITHVFPVTTAVGSSLLGLGYFFVFLAVGVTLGKVSA